MADEAKNEQKKNVTTKVEASEGAASYNMEKASEITVQTTGNFQLYDAATQTTYGVEKKVKRPENDQFVVTNIKRGKLKKVS